MLTVARVLIVVGIFLFLVGGGIYLLARVGLPLGRLPGDLRFQWEGVTCFLPLGTSVLISILLSLILTVAFRLMNR
ncbi:MAG: DUF2905 domain-containing protein [Anaerolineales bacterium]|nr:DUF2905 domain-containing protein [Anaerolineales bacterium]